MIKNSPWSPDAFPIGERTIIVDNLAKMARVPFQKGAVPDSLGAYYLRTKLENMGYLHYEGLLPQVIRLKPDKDHPAPWIVVRFKDRRCAIIARSNKRIVAHGLGLREARDMLSRGRGTDIHA